MTRKVPLSEMREAAADEAADIRSGQRALVTSGLRSTFHPGQIAKAEALEAICRLIDKIAGNKRMLELLKEGE